MIPYRDIDALNWSKLKAMARSPMYYQHCLANPISQTPAMLVGSATHCASLEGTGVLESRYVVLPDFGDQRYKENKIKKAEWLEREADRSELAGKPRAELTAGQMRLVTSMQEAIHANGQARELIADVKPEQHFLWTDVVTGIKCKGQQDGIGTECQVSLKTTKAETPEQFGREYFNRLYHGQTAYYVDGYNDATGVDLPEVVIAVQNMAPFDCWVLEIPDAAVDEGRQLCLKLMEQLKHCMDTNHWPGAVPTRDALHIPSWAVHEENEIADLGLEF